MSGCQLLAGPGAPSLDTILDRKEVGSLQGRMAVLVRDFTVTHSEIAYALLKVCCQGAL